MDFFSWSSRKASITLITQIGPKKHLKKESVQVALDLTDPKDTLIIVTGDHSHSWTINGYPKRGNDILGSVYDVARKRYIQNYDGSFSPYSTITYANGMGFKDHFTNDSKKAWEGKINYNNNNYRAPAQFLRKKETHGAVVKMYRYTHLDLGRIYLMVSTNRIILHMQ